MSPTESGIPLLTEIIDAPVYGVDLPERRIAPQAALQSAPRSLPAPAAGAGDAAPPAMLSPTTIARIERDVSQRVLQQLMEEVEQVLEQRIRDNLADVLQTAVDGLAGQLRHGLKRTLEEALAHAVAREMKNLRNTKIEDLA